MPLSSIVLFLISSGFNEAGAGCPGMRRQTVLDCLDRTASMRPGQAAPECTTSVTTTTFLTGASMRPGQAAPECQKKMSGKVIRIWRFNEAGAGCPGMLAALLAAEIPGQRFNEAGAGCPGMR